MKIKKTKEKPILARARKPAELASRSRFKVILETVRGRWKTVAAVAGAAFLVGAAIGGYSWYRHDREVRAAKAYATVQKNVRERVEAEVKKAGESGRVDDKKIAGIAEDELRNMIERYPDTSTGLAATYELASLCFEQGDYKEARALFATVEAKTKGLEKTLAAKGVADCDRALNDKARALAEYRELYDQEPDGFPGVAIGMDLAELYVAAGKPEEAKKIYRRIVEYDALSAYAGDAARELALLENVTP